MSSLKKVLIADSGLSGMSLAICLRRVGIAVDLIERDPQWRPIGAGLSLNGVSLRAFQRIGVLEQLRARGHLHSGLDLLDFSGRLLHRVTPPPDPDGVPGGGGILRPLLHQILAEAVRSTGPNPTRCERCIAGRSGLVYVGAIDTREERSYDLVVGYGCGLAAEDAIVLAEEVTRESSLQAALERFVQRRLGRCRAVVKGSANLGELERAHAPLSEHQAATAAIAQAIAQPI